MPLAHAAIDLDRVRSMRFPVVQRGFEAEPVLDVIATLCDEIERLRNGGTFAAPPAMTSSDINAALARISAAIERLAARLAERSEAA